MLNERQPVAGNISLIELFLKEQTETAVETFSGLHEAQALSDQPVYKELIPLEKPLPGQQFSFEVDLDKCSGCKACVTACHNLNGLDSAETWRSVGLIHDSRGLQTPPKRRTASITFKEFEPPAAPQAPPPVAPITDLLQMNVTSACHHCLEPGCLSGCPVKAYEKDPLTGIVKHLDDQCIGCKYCLFMCPYDVPQYNAKQGIVRKCDMCSDRLAAGEAPACVQSCPTQAIRITVVDTAQVRRSPANYVNVPGAPDSQFTLPTTTFKTKRKLPVTMQAGDHHLVKAAEPEYPLLFMLVLMQLSTGAYLFEFILGHVFQYSHIDALAPLLTLVAFISGAVGMAVVQLHMGRPFYAFRAFLGLRSSWLSREAIAGLVYLPLAASYTALHWFVPGFGPGLTLACGGLLALSALLFLFSSTMVYKATPRPLWRGQRTVIKFNTTAIIMGAATFLLCASVTAHALGLPIAQLMQGFGGIVAGLLIITSILKLAYEQRFLTHLYDNELTPFKRAAILMDRVYGHIGHIRLAAALFGGILLPLALLANTSTAGAILIAGLMFILTLLAEISERYLFFTCAVPSKMPGTPAGRK